MLWHACDILGTLHLFFRPQTTITSWLPVPPIRDVAWLTALTPVGGEKNPNPQRECFVYYIIRFGGIFLLCFKMNTSCLHKSILLDSNHYFVSFYFSSRITLFPLFLLFLYFVSVHLSFFFSFPILWALFYMYSLTICNGLNVHVPQNSHVIT